MTQPVSDIAFTPSVKKVQARLGSRQHYARIEQGPGWQDVITSELVDFITARDSFFLGTASKAGQPYIQHRGGPKGFLKVLDDHTLAFADLPGNRQYITLGNLAENKKAFIFLIDYANQSRIKIWGNAEVVENDQALLRQLTASSYRSRPERGIRFLVEAWDVNCRQHIPRLYAEKHMQATLQTLRDRISVLEKENAALRGQTAEWVKHSS